MKTGRCLICDYVVEFKPEDGFSEEQMIAWMYNHCEVQHRDPDWEPENNPVDGVDPVDWKGDPEQCKWVIEG